MTKAATVKKRRKHRGRPRDETADRTPSGQKSRAAPRVDIRTVAIKSRAVRYDLPQKWKDHRGVEYEGLDIAAHPYAATHIGRMHLQGQITRTMLDAGERYLEIYNAAMIAIKAPVGLRKTNVAGDGGDLITEDYVEWAIRAVAHYEAIKACMTDEVCKAVEMLVVDDRPPLNEMAAKLGLISLSEKLGLGKGE